MATTTTSATPWPDHIMEQYRWLDECLLQLPATVKEFQPTWQAYKYLLGGKMFAYVGVNDSNNRPIVTLKLEPLYSDLLRQEYPDIVPAYYMNKVHWSTVYLDGQVPREVLADVAYASHKWLLSSLPKKVQREILGE
jgi:predicted DNA-binding protein (MmcQ/YjbR family)